MKMALYIFGIFILYYMHMVLNGSNTNPVYADKGSGYSALMVSRQKNTNEGYEWARQRNIRSHAQCREQWTNENNQPFERSGCSRYVSEVNVLNNLPAVPVHDSWEDGTTTAECVAELHAYWDPLLQDMLERLDDMAYSARKHELDNALRRCRNFDNLAGLNNGILPESETEDESDRERSGGGADEEIVARDGKFVGMSKYEFREHQRRQFEKVERKMRQKQENSLRHEY